MDRYLTPDEKQQELAAWHALCADGRVTRNSEGGRGFPDADMIAWCKRLNAIVGICTVQSCAGHGSALSGGVVLSAHLWLRLDQEMSAAFDRHAFRLAAHADLIEQVARAYTAWGKEIAFITFAGNERDSLHRSMRLIVAFFHSLHVKARAA